MTEPKKAVEGKQAGNSSSGANKQPARSTHNRKPALQKAQVKSAVSKSPSKASASASKESSTSADSAKLKENAARAEALENINILLPEEKFTSISVTEPADVTGIIVPSDKEEMNVTKPVREMMPDGKGNLDADKSDGKHKKKDKVKQMKSFGDSHTNEIHEVGKPVKGKATLQQKTAKAEKKVNKLKKKVHKAEKKEVKKSKLRILKEKLTKAFSKWQRRKKKLDDADK